LPAGSFLVWLYTIIAFAFLYWDLTEAALKCAHWPRQSSPISRWAKLAMAVQATASLAILGRVIARAINLLQ
jgi:hypothetical protein